ncbi:MAG: FumA C-terminus/TtdB family hydratase beta subunit [Candidatus Ratteibacteria bacterium]|nr:FumA C-terminus/TtdB family hydratase beta subunit [Candidatus Ratteibacteria bacterium]
MITKARKLIVPVENKKILADFHPGEFISVSGFVYTARDKAHQRLIDSLRKKRPIPVDLNNQFLYYTGPTPSPPGRISGAIGPTTSSRMDKFTPELLSLGLAGTIGKGKRDKAVIAAIKKFKAVYLITIGGAAAYLSKRVKSLSRVAYKDLGPEAIFRVEVEDFPVIVAIDSRGLSIY